MNKIIKFLRNAIPNPKREHIMFMSFEEGKNLFEIECEPNFTIRYDMDVTDDKINPAFEGSIEINGFIFYFINPNKLT